MTLPDGSWLDNRPCDRVNPRFRRLAMASVLAVCLPFVPLMYLVFVFAGSSTSTALIAGGTYGIGGAALFCSLMFIADSSMPAEIMFGPNGILWRTKRGRVLRAPYATLEMPRPSPSKYDWHDGVCSRFILVIQGRSVLVRRIIHLNASNKDRLEAILRPKSVSKNGQPR